VNFFVEAWVLGQKSRGIIAPFALGALVGVNRDKKRQSHEKQQENVILPPNGS
jgi:hypothetical protein